MRAEDKDALLDMFFQKMSRCCRTEEFDEKVLGGWKVSVGWSREQLGLVGAADKHGMIYMCASNGIWSLNASSSCAIGYRLQAVGDEAWQLS